MSTDGFKRGTNNHWLSYLAALRFVRTLALAAGWIAASHGSLADVAMSGSFLATQDCPAFQSFRKATNPGEVKLEPGHSYPLLAKNAPNATHYRIRIEGAAPPERWVGVNCGSSGEQGANSGSPQTELVLSLGWEPSFCESHANRPECANETPNSFDADHFILHGLWPQPRRREYCNVSQSLIDADKNGDWQALPDIDLAPETRAHLAVAMPGTQSFLERHEWIRHGTCYGADDAETYFREALSLVDSVNGSAVQALFADNVGREVTVAAVRGAFDAAFGVGAGDRVRLACRQVGSRRVITEITIGLGARPGGDKRLADLIKTSSPTDPGCPGGTVDPVGHQ